MSSARLKTRALKALVGALGALVLLAIGAVAFIGPRNVLGILRYDQRREGALRIGDRAPDVTLVGLDGKAVHLADAIGARPLVLIFGSFT